MVYDLIIVGMGVAGVTSAIYAKRAGLNILCFDKKMIGGNLNYIDRIDNYPGLYGISGSEFAFKLYNTLKEMGIEVNNHGVDKIVDEGNVKKVYIGKDIYKAKNVIIAIGRKMRTLGLEGEDKLLGKGISRCALCDGAFYKEREVGVVGGGNSALQESLYLANICSKVYLIHRRDNFKGDKELIDKVKGNDKIEIIYNANVKELISDKILTGIKLDSGRKIDISGLFIYVGFEPDTSVYDNLGIDDNDGYIVVDSKMKTKVNGIYAVGDCVKKEVYQISNAVGEGTIASIDIVKEM